MAAPGAPSSGICVLTAAVGQKFFPFHPRMVAVGTPSSGICVPTVVVGQKFFPFHPRMVAVGAPSPGVCVLTATVRLALESFMFLNGNTWHTFVVCMCADRYCSTRIGAFYDSER